MRNFFFNLNYRIREFMQGRYGVDELSNAIAVVSISLIVLSALLSLPILYLLALILAAFGIFRCCSKDAAKRRKELERYIAKKQKITKKIKFRKDLHEMKKTHRLYRCKKCRTILRVPKGAGKIKITCSRCKTTMIKRA